MKKEEKKEVPPQIYQFVVNEERLKKSIDFPAVFKVVVDEEVARKYFDEDAINIFRAIAAKKSRLKDQIAFLKQPKKNVIKGRKEIRTRFNLKRVEYVIGVAFGSGILKAVPIYNDSMN